METERRIRYLNQNEKERSRDLWEACFPEDSARFLDYYYREKCRDNQILVMEEGADRRIVSMIHQNPYILRCSGRDYCIDYLVAVATAEDRRHRGYMRSLLKAVLQEENRRKMPFSFLMPADPKIYEPFGFVYVCDQARWQWNTAAESLRRETAPVEALLRGEGPSAMTAVFGGIGEWLEKQRSACSEVYARCTAEYMDRMWKEIRSEEGELTLLFDGERLAGMECFWGGEERERRFLYGEREFLRKEGEPAPAMMARIVNLEEMMKGVRLKHKGVCRLTVKVRDEMLEENNGIFIWEIRPEGTEIRRVDQPGEKMGPVPSVSVAELTGWVTGYRGAPGGLEALEQNVLTWGRIFLDEVV